MKMIEGKYKPFQGPQLLDRQWPSQAITKEPIWCEVSLRDGNQALQNAMSIEAKLRLFDALIDSGFKQIEIGFPAASTIDYDFVRTLIENELIPEDVSIQVLLQAREEQVIKTISALKGAKNAIIHLYNSTSQAQRRVVFGKTKEEIIQIAVEVTGMIKKRIGELVGTKVTFQYSPESFSATETEFALEVCNSVIEVWEPTPEDPMIINLPETVQMASSNVYADQIEWMNDMLDRRDSVILSVHTHNDRGTGVASSEFAIMAGADRVEGTIFGNGERTGNADLVTIALNMYNQGVDIDLDLSDIPNLRKVYEETSGMKVPLRHPYAGDLVFTAFSGSHQDAIAKGFAEREKDPSIPFDVPYFVIDPADIGRTYESFIRVNSQSGKGGISYLLEKKFGLLIPKDMQKEFGHIAGRMIDKFGGREVLAPELKDMFWKEYILRDNPWNIEWLTNQLGGKELVNSGVGPIDSLVKAILSTGKTSSFEIIDYKEHALGKGSEASAIAYVCIKAAERKVWGAGVDADIEKSAAKAVFSALNRL